jgi:hypothetical protein
VFEGSHSIKSSKPSGCGSSTQSTPLLESYQPVGHSQLGGALYDGLLQVIQTLLESQEAHSALHN